ncbi:MAG: DUF3383 domain-containing protein [Puniceicoccales bacterium]|jgi:hypothetical protein|nr:DUF3383 domain-containing protein [Puniceicoccales bacterium]
MPNINNVAIFSNECRLDFGNVKFYISIGQVGEDFALSLAPYAMATEIFAQTPNQLSSQAVLAIVNTDAADATPAVWTSIDLVSNFENFQKVANGAMTITSSWGMESVVWLDFRTIGNIADLASVINEGFENYDVEADDETIVITSKSVGEGTQFTLGSLGSGTDITGEDFLDATEGDYEDGINGSGESIGDAVIRGQSIASFVGIVGDPGKVDSQQIKDAGVDVYGNFGKISRTITSGENTYFDRM